ncbi:DUF6174 domain-containing protein [Nocardioides sp.]|uniref:DUF6174 domain-containing protein n=1 Tax=Nocardioides sp. TaxID=35761 RepID=UPI00260FDC1A|nr:DUF6174 domain-containing protein [Nocardioides sp.]
MKRAVLAALLPLTIGAGAAPAVAAADPQPVQPFVPGINEEPELSAAWQRWQTKGIDDYVITVRLSCFCVPSDAVRTLIRNDSTRRVTRGERALSPRRGYSVDELFTMIRSASAEADRVDVDYTRRGVPKTIAIDPDEMVADEETYYSVSLTRLD